MLPDCDNSGASSSLLWPIGIIAVLGGKHFNAALAFASD
jgi:hypothetical protein